MLRDGAGRYAAAMIWVLVFFLFAFVLGGTMGKQAFWVALFPAALGAFDLWIEGFDERSVILIAASIAVSILGVALGRALILPRFSS